MTRHVIALALVSIALGVLPVAASAPEQSPRPVARLSAQAAALPTVLDQNLTLRPQKRPQLRPQQENVVVARMAISHSLQVRPHLRPPSEQAQSSAARPETLAFFSPDVSARPYPRPDSVVQEALFGRAKRRKGSVCGDVDIQGEKIGRVPGKLNGCGVKDAVRVRSISGVMLSRPATMDCPTAKALNQWVKDGIKPAFRRRGPVVELKVAAHYACRTRNNQRGAKISEHGKGKAIDISAFVMNDGEVITVQKGWGQGTTRKILHKVWKSACGPFGTVLGPKADRYHQDHFHVDTAHHRGGSYCH